jgi:cyclophilin family peptidyl-prolyl cis-trans isomerase
MPRSRKFRKSQNKAKPEWGKNNPQTKAKNRKRTIVIGAIVIAIVVISASVVLGQNVLFPTSSSSPSPSPSATPTPSVTPQPEATPATSPAGEYSSSGTRVLLMVEGTDASGNAFTGNITIQMRDDNPITTTNFVNLVEQGVYDGTLFHRVIPGFMVQGGQTTATVAEISDEIGNDNHNYNGTIAMAKTAYANSATSGFFINIADNNEITYSDGTQFDATYTVFGKVIGGMDVVMKIAQVETQENPLMQNENSQPVYSVTLVKAMVLP